MYLTKKLRLFLLALLALSLTLWFAAHVFSNYAEEKINLVLNKNHINVSSVSVNLITRSIDLKNVKWRLEGDSAGVLPHTLELRSLRLEGISVYAWLAHKRIHVHKIVIDGGQLQINKNLKRGATEDQKISGVKELSIDILNLQNITAEIFRDSIPEYSGSVTGILRKIGLNDINQAKEPSSYTIKSFEAVATNIKIPGKGKMYRSSISRLYVNSVDQNVEIDSILITPNYSKYQFSRKAGSQIDRINTIIPKLSVSGLSYSKIKDSLFIASGIVLTSARIHVFRDKRLPFTKTKNNPLPIALIRDFKFELAVDSIRLIDAKVTYEEFPEKGFHTGHISFEKLNATIDHISNRNHFPGYKQATLKVTSNIMGKGLIKADFTLPYGPSQIYNAKGSVTRLALHRLNPVLENLTFTSITSGTLNSLAFNFDYTDVKATGTVLVNYENLKITSLTKEKDAEKNEFKSFIANVILKKDKDEKEDKSKSQGIIDFERDKRRSVFHYWWKSLYSGLKSTVIDSRGKKEKESR